MKTPRLDRLRLLLCVSGFLTGAKDRACREDQRSDQMPQGRRSHGLKPPARISARVRYASSLVCCNPRMYASNCRLVVHKAIVAVTWALALAPAAGSLVRFLDQGAVRQRAAVAAGDFTVATVPVTGVVTARRGLPRLLRPSRGTLPGPSRSRISLKPVRRVGSRSRCTMTY